MSNARRWLLRLLTLLRSERAEHELAREMDAHLALLEDDYRRRGLTGDEARVAARRAMGGVEQAKELQRQARSWSWLDDARRDTRHAIRSLRRTPGFTAVAVLTLAIGIGANTAVFSVVNAVLLRPLPFQNTERIVRIFEHVTGPLGGQLRQGLPRGEVSQLRELSPTLSHVDAYGTLVELRLGRDEDIELPGARISRDLLTLLDARPTLGRLFDARESEAMEPVIVLSHRVWQRQFGGRQDVLGQAVIVDSTFMMGPPRRAYTVIGVMAEGFLFPDGETQFWIPLNVEREGGVGTIAYLEEGVATDVAAEDVSAILGRLRGERAPRIEVVNLHDEMVAPIRPALRALAVAVGLLLLISCANVANLVLARNLSRQREIAVRTALGAGRSRLLRQLVTEGVVLSLIGGVVGIALAFGGLAAMRVLLSEVGGLTTIRQVGAGGGSSMMPTGVEAITPDIPVLVATAALCLITGLLFGTIPAIGPRVRALVDALRQGSTTATGGFGLLRHDATRSLLVLTQVALAVTLLIGGGLVVHSFLKLAIVDHGYDPSGVLTFQVRLPAGRYSSATLGQFADTVDGRLRTVVGVREAGYSLSLPLVPMASSTSMRLSPDEQLPPPAGAVPSAHHPGIHAVSRTYPLAMGMRIVQGGGWTGEGGSIRRGVLINETLARARFAADSPIGRLVYFGPDPVAILGVVADVRQQGADVAPTPAVFVDLADWGLPPMGFTPNLHYVIRASGPQAQLAHGIRTVLGQIDGEALIDNLAPMDRLVAGSIARPRVYATLFGTFAGLAALVAAIGIYGGMSYAVAQSTREIGVRVALGAPRSVVLRLVLGRAALLTGVGLTLGVALAWATTRYLRGILFGVTPLDGATYAAVVLAFAIVALLASYVPARRATRVDPLVALRYE